MDRFEQARHYLGQLQREALAGDSQLAFKGFLARIDFDYSLTSLDRIDAMLQTIRQSMKLDYTAFLAKQPGVDFVVALNFYLGTTIARAGNFALKWIDHAQARQYMPDLPQQLDFDLGCLLADRVVFPANIINEALFAPTVERTCGGYARSLIAQLTAAGQRLPDPLPRPQTASAPSPLPAPLREALEGAGFLGAWAMATMPDGGSFAPLMLNPSADGRNAVVDVGSLAANAADAVASAHARLDNNADNLPWQALAYDGLINLPTGRRDAVVVELRHFASRPPFRLTMLLPYRARRERDGFANFSPRAMACSSSGPELPAIHDAFYRGLYTMKGFDWNAHLIEE
jgi:hypothetical protein